MSILPVSKTFPTLYGVSSKGITKVWKIAVFKGDRDAMIFVEHGQLNGKIQKSPETIREGKNIGRANETSPYEQALLEAESKWKKQHDKNYTEICPTEGAVIALKHLPMLAQKYKERKHLLVWPAFVQPKLDGMRCLVQRVGDKIIYWSRKAKRLKNFNLYMDAEFLSIMKDGDILDGEMYNHGDLTFQELMSVIKDEKRPELDKLKRYVKFWCYDRPLGKLGFKDRYADWDLDISHLKHIVLVETIKVHNEKDVNRHHGRYMEDGYEGSIVRSGGDEPYTFQYRDNQLQKNKDFIDDEFIIIGAREGKGKDEGQAILICKTPQGIGGETGIGDFGVKCKGVNAVRIEQWKNWKKYVGKEVTVRFQELSDEFIPRFPVGIIVRDYE